MLGIELSPVSKKFVGKLPPKHRRQVTERIFTLAKNPQAPDARRLQGYEAYYRVDIGEYRIVYRLSTTILFVTLVGKRNDDEVYRKLRRMAK